MVILLEMQYLKIIYVLKGHHCDSVDGTVASQSMKILGRQN